LGRRTFRTVQRWPRCSWRAGYVWASQSWNSFSSICIVSLFQVSGNQSLSRSYWLWRNKPGHLKQEISFYKGNCLLTLWLNVNVLWMLLFAELLHSEHLRVVVQVVKHMRVLITPQPFIFPIKAYGFRPAQILPQLVFIFASYHFNVPSVLGRMIQALFLHIGGDGCQLNLTTGALSLPRLLLC